MNVRGNLHSGSGFTLIELLVVIAIIGILSAVILASLSTARTKGSDAAIQSNLATIQVQAEIYFTLNNSYGVGVANANCSLGMFGADTTIKNALTSIASINGSTLNGGANTGLMCNSNSVTQAYAVAAKLTSVNYYWCIDSAGKVSTTTVSGFGAGTVACP